MAITCKIVLGASTLYPMFPVERSAAPIGTELPTASGRRRFAWRSTKRSFTLVLTDADEAERATWAAAFANSVSAAVTLTMEDGATFSVRSTSFADPLVRTIPVTPGGLNTTGAGFYDLSITAEEV